MSDRTPTPFRPRGNGTAVIDGEGVDAMVAVRWGLRGLKIIKAVTGVRGREAGEWLHGVGVDNDGRNEHDEDAED